MFLKAMACALIIASGVMVVLCNMFATTDFWNENIVILSFDDKPRISHDITDIQHFLQAHVLCLAISRFQMGLPVCQSHFVQKFVECVLCHTWLALFLRSIYLDKFHQWYSFRPRTSVLSPPIASRGRQQRKQKNRPRVYLVSLDHTLRAI